jgi:hypothetical protein
MEGIKNYELALVLVRSLSDWNAVLEKQCDMSVFEIRHSKAIESFN